MILSSIKLIFLVLQYLMGDLDNIMSLDIAPYISVYYQLNIIIMKIKIQDIHFSLWLFYNSEHFPSQLLAISASFDSEKIPGEKILNIESTIQ